jgi:hypothetical protein
MAHQNYKTVCIGAIMIALFSIPSAHAGDENAPKQQDEALSKPKDLSWAVMIPKEDKVDYRGVVSFDKAGQGTGAMLYPTGGLGIAGLLVGIATHAAIVGGAKSSQKTAMQLKADEVLLPYRPVLDKYTNQELLQSSLQLTTISSNTKLIPSSEKSITDQTIESSPVFSLTQDQSTIVLENTISISTASKASTNAYQNTVKVVSSLRSGTEHTKFWTDNQGEKLKEVSARLMAYSLDMAINDLKNNSKNDKPQKTFRYMEGDTEKMERGELISETCNRLVMKNLRGWLVSIPVQSKEAVQSNEQCNDILSLK